MENNFIAEKIKYLKEINNTFLINTEILFQYFNTSVNNNKLISWYYSLSMSNQTTFFNICIKRVCDFFTEELLTEIWDHINDDMIQIVFNALLYAIKDLVTEKTYLASLEKELQHDSIFIKNNEIYQIMYSKLEEAKIFTFKTQEIQL